MCMMGRTLMFSIGAGGTSKGKTLDMTDISSLKQYQILRHCGMNDLYLHGRSGDR